MKIRVQKLNQNAKMPKYALDGDAGMDIFSTESKTLAVGEKHIFGTGIAIKVPDGHVGLVWDKGGVGQKFGVKTLGGVLDSNYTGEMFVALVNLGSEPFVVDRGQKIAQMLFQHVEKAEVEEVEIMPETVRREGRHGSTGRF